GGGAHRARERGGAAGAADGRGGALGERDPRVLAALGAGFQAGGAPGSGEAARGGDGRRLPPGAEALDERGRRRGATRVRGEAEAGVEGTVASPLPRTRRHGVGAAARARAGRQAPR